MTSIIKADNISTVSGSGSITIPTGVKVVGTDTGSVYAPGMAVQQLTVNDMAQLSINTTSLTATNLSLSFTPKFSNSRVVIEGHLGCHVAGSNNQGIGANLYIDGSQITNTTNYLGLSSNSNKFILFYHDSGHTRDHYTNLPYKVIADGQFTAGTSYTVEIRVRGWITTASQNLHNGGYNGSIMTITEFAQ